MVVDRELQNAKENVLELMKQKQNIENEINTLKAILDTNNVGMEEPLIDSEGYPRNDIDVYHIRHSRHKIICLTNDHKALMMKIEEGLHQVHSLLGKHDTNTIEEVNASTSRTDDEIQLEAFLRIDLVSPDSPAAIAGLQEEDLILQFGTINYRNFCSLKDFCSLVENSRYKDVHIKIRRRSEIIDLRLTPRPWDGNGLLGCHIIPLETIER
ncbi:26S proteasome non-ATPase regulatory subunit 9 [Prorops nasuta]|uniref:26S proteasome non-ATPase regulatory subunit 9 n=1 Tax=Prorops nasuta TaxID=863751 RepID=UPI0034CDE8E7